MITNERQYKITRSQLESFVDALKPFDSAEGINKIKSDKLFKAEKDALESEVEKLSEQINEYDLLKSGSFPILEARNLEELPMLLIKARIAKGYSQRKLAEVIGLKEQQIQKYEAEEYATANIIRIAEIAKGLGLNISEVAEFKEVSSSKNLNLDWNKFPIKSMYIRNWLDYSGTLEMAIVKNEELAKEFVENCFNKSIYAAARKRVPTGSSSDIYALIAWQCRLIKLAKKKKSKQFNRKTLSDLWFKELRSISLEVNGPKNAVEYLEDAGIRTVVVPHLSSTYLDGAILLLSDGPVLGMTLRYDRLDNFWFVLFHELMHIKNNTFKKCNDIILEDIEDLNDSVEKNIDEYAGEMLIQSKQWETALARFVRSKDSIEAFAKEIGVNPAVVAGKIRREANNYTLLNDMVGQGQVRKLFPDVDFSC